MSRSEGQPTVLSLPHSRLLLFFSTKVRLVALNYTMGGKGEGHRRVVDNGNLEGDGMLQTDTLPYDFWRRRRGVIPRHAEKLVLWPR